MTSFLGSFLLDFPQLLWKTRVRVQIISASTFLKKRGIIIVILHMITSTHNVTGECLLQKNKNRMMNAQDCALGSTYDQNRLTISFHRKGTKVWWEAYNGGKLVCVCPSREKAKEFLGAL